MGRRRKGKIRIMKKRKNKDVRNPQFGANDSFRTRNELC